MPWVRPKYRKSHTKAKTDEAISADAKAKASSGEAPGKGASKVLVKKVAPKLTAYTGKVLKAKAKGIPANSHDRKGREVESLGGAAEETPKKRRRWATTAEMMRRTPEANNDNAPGETGEVTELPPASMAPDARGEAESTLKLWPELSSSILAEQSPASVKMEAPHDTAGTDLWPQAVTGTKGVEVSPKVEREAVSAGSKAKSSHKSPDAQAAAKISKAGTRFLGAAPTVMLTHGLPDPPRGLLPEDTVLMRMKLKKGPQLPAHCHAKAVAEAKKAGCKATRPWPGLGEIPEVLKGGFRSLVILGPSGSGKSTLLRALLDEFFPRYQGPLYPGGDWCPGRATIEAFDTAYRGRDLLGSVGLSSVPSWCKPFEVLSVGEKYRANIALVLQQRDRDPSLPVVFDEWTSELDRGLARVVSVSLGKRLRQEASIEGGAGQDDTQGHQQGGEDEEEALPRGTGEMEGEEEDFPRTAPEGMPDCAEEEAEGFEDQGEEDDGAGGSEDEERQPEADACVKWRRMESPDGVEEEEGASEAGDQAELGEEAGDSEAVMGALEAALFGVRAGEEEDHGEATQPGPFIFATCHEDVVAYLQPDFVVLCSVGEAPRAFRNDNSGRGLALHSVLKGDLVPLPIHRGCHMLVGHWMVKTQEIEPFMINYQGSKAQDIFRLTCEGGRKDTLRRSADHCPKSGLSAWYSSAAPSTDRSVEHHEIRLRVVSERSLYLQLRKNADSSWSKEVKATRRSLPQAVQALMLTRDPESVAYASTSMNYRDFDEGVLMSHGWYLPPELAPDGKYGGLQRRREPELVSCTDFKYNAKLEKLDEHQRFLATYVGEPEGGLSAKLQAVSQLLDCPFDGLCMHKIPQLPPLDDFCIGVITGPSGSGKSTLAQHLFGPSPLVAWAPESPVLAHFASLASARELCGAAGLDLNSALRPYGALSTGEQSRADLARILQKAVASADAGTSAGAEGQALVIDEFTSKVDRPVARRMARGIQRLAQRRRLQRLVIVSCHDDFVGRDLLEPDWLFECRNSRLLHFQSREAVEAAKEEEPFNQKLLYAKSSLSEAQKEIDLLSKCLANTSAASCFSETFKTDLAVMSKAMAAFCEEELQRHHAEVSTADASANHARQAAVERFRSQQAAADAESEAQGSAALEVEAEEPEARLPRLLEPPTLELEVRRALPREWVHFREHHYKDHSLHTASVCFVGLLDGQAACFLAMVQEATNWVQKNVRSTSKSAEWANMGYPKIWAKDKWRRLYREHRTVVLPDFQGMGMAPLLCDSVALHVLKTGHDFTSQTVHPFYGGYRDRSPFWQALPSNRKGWSQLNGNYKFSHVFVGAVRPNGQTDPTLAAQLKRRVSSVGFHK